MEGIVSRERIAKQADEAAQAWVQDQGQPKPPNPFDAQLQPDHHCQWEASFARYVTIYSTGEVSA